MLSYEEALERLLLQVPSPHPDPVPLESALGRILAEPVLADLDLPPFDKSFMDGYAIRTQDLDSVPQTLDVVGVSAAGIVPGPPVARGQAVQIMTGARLPVGADAVQVVEKTQQSDGKVYILERVEPGANIAPRGSEVKKSTEVLARGRWIGPAEIGVLATFGRTEVPVFRAPTVAIVSTGDELVPIDQQPQLGQIRNSNAYMLWAQCRSLGLDARIFPAVPDDPSQIRQIVERGLERDILIFSGGVSMGEFDFVHRVLGEAGVEIFFHKTAIRPGKPVIVGRKDARMVFGLPGNPVSSFVTFELFVRPAVRKWMGCTNLTLLKLQGELTRDVTQKPGRLFFKPARTLFTAAGARVEPIETKGSADITAFSAADSLLLIPASCSLLKEGSQVEVMLMANRQHACPSR